MHTVEKTFYSCAKLMAEFFMPLAQFTLYNEHHQEIATFGDLTQERFSKDSSQVVQQVVFNKTHQGKIQTIPLTHGYYFVVLADLSLFAPLQKILHQYLTGKSGTPSVDSWQNQVDAIINVYLTNCHKTFRDLSNHDRRQLILDLHAQDLLRYQDATKLLAAKLKVSRATLYNYLKEANELQSIEIHQVDTFTNKPFSGNPAGVVLDADNLSDDLMKKITREMNLSETSFVLPSQKADFKCRYFTPTGHEVKFCGHSTVGALFMIAHEQRLGIKEPGRYAFTLETKAGNLPVAIDYQLNQAVAIEYETPKVDLCESKLNHKDLAKALNIPLNIIDISKPVMYEQTNQDIYITINSLKDLGKIKINEKTAEKFALKHRIVAYVLLVGEGIEKNHDFHMRCFAPAVGIPEDPFTGSVLGGLACYVYQLGMLDKRKKTFIVEQGHFMKRPGQVQITINAKDKCAAPIVTAQARHFFSTRINL